MEVRGLYRKEVLSAAPDESLAEAASRMQFEEVGSLAILEHGKLVGIVTERDLARAVADGVNPFVTAVSGYMTEEPVTVTPDMDAEEAAGIMLSNGLRHLPVMESGRMVGMVSSRDLLSPESRNASGSG